MHLAPAGMVAAKLRSAYEIVENGAVIDPADVEPNPSLIPSLLT